MQSVKMRLEERLSDKKAITTTIFLLFFFGSIVPITAYDSSEEAQEPTRMASASVVPDVTENIISEKSLIVPEKILPASMVSEKPVVIGRGHPYTLGNEDVLQIIVRNQPEFSGQFVIGPDGKIQYTFVGDIEAAGLTKEQLKQSLIRELVRFVKSPEISITIAAYKSKNVYLLGELVNPGKYPMKGDVISLREAIVEAGLPTPQAALRRIYIIKNDPVKPTYIKVDLYTLLYKGNMRQNIDLFSGDIVVVPSTVPSEINRALNTLLSPVFQAASVDALLYNNRKR